VKKAKGMLLQYKDISTSEGKRRKLETVFTSREITFAYGEKDLGKSVTGKQ